MTSYNIEMILQEVSSYAPKKLREIDSVFEKLKKSTNNKKTRAELITKIKEFTKIKDVSVIFDREYNAAVLPIYKESSISNILKEFVNFATDNPDKWDSTDPKKLAKMVTVSEPADMVQKIYLYIGKPLLEDMTATEMTAILLHEFGHVYSTTSFIPLYICRMVKGITGFIAKVGTFLTPGLTRLFSTAFLGPFALYIFFATVLAHGITFRERAGEYAADNYAAKYGYGDELVLAMRKLGGLEVQTKAGFTVEEVFKKILLFIIFLLFPSGFTHPDAEKRIENLEDKIFNKYKSIYPKYKEFLEKAQAEYSKGK